MLESTNAIEGKAQRRDQAPARGSKSHVIGSKIGHIGIWVEGVDRLGVMYEGVWRVIKLFLQSSAGSGKTFSFIAPARFQKEIEDLLVELPAAVRETVNFIPFGAGSNRYDKAEAMRQAVFANGLDLDAWLVPNPMWAAAKHLIRPKVVWFHDFLLLEFPQSYSRTLFTQFEQNVEELRDSGSFFIFSSPYVRQVHGLEHCGVSLDQSLLVLTPSFDSAPILKDITEDRRHCGDLIRSELRDKLRSWCSPHHADLFYHHISSYPFESVPYFFVSSQNREHKGFLRLAEIYAAMLRERYLPYSVFTTALVDVQGHSPLEKFLKAELLFGDFMSVGKVSDLTLALLFKFARLTIHPSTFEGNLPLPFAESVSVGTPCIMPYSRAFAQFVDRSMHPWVFFSPTQAGLSDKVAEVESHRSEFVAAQRDILRKLQEYSLADYFRLQMTAFERAETQRPVAANYLVDSRGTNVQQHRTLGQRLGLPRLFRAQTVDSAIHVRVWPRFELKAANTDSEGADTLHWAAYLGEDHPKGDCYFLATVEGPDSSTVEGRGLIAELGSWVDGDYVVSGRGSFRFAPLGDLPDSLRTILQNSQTLDLIGAPSAIGWIKLAWERGIVPEIRVAGPELDIGAEARVKLVSLSDFSAASEPELRSGLEMTKVDD